MKKQFTFHSIVVICLFIIMFRTDLTTGQSNCPEGLISYWKFDEIGGVETFLDSFGGYNASCNDTECPTETNGILNKARNFNGSDEINVPDENVFDWGINTSFSVEAWIKTTQPGTGNKVFIGKARGGSNMSWWLGFGDNNKAIFRVRDSSNISALLEGETEINDGNWHHIVGVRNANTSVLQIFIDGVKENEVSTFFTGDFSGSNPIYIGYFGSGGFHYNGLLDEVAIYDTALTESEITDHYNNSLAGMDYCDQSTDIKDDKIILDNYFLFQNYPNPFNPSTKIGFTIPQNFQPLVLVTLRVYDVLGNEIATIVNEEKAAGVYEVEFPVNGSSPLHGDAAHLSSGIYFYKLQAGDFVQSRKMMFLK